MKNSKKAFLNSLLALVLCISMLIGTTYAWFTDTAVSAGNKIQAGTLKIDLELLDKESGEWASIKESEEAIFGYEKWEPGYTEVKILRVVNEGNLALRWVAKLATETKLSALADVIDVYVKNGAEGYPADRNLEGYTRVGTVAEFAGTIEETTYGTLLKGQSANLGIALKMQESAGNDYQTLDLGGAFDIQIFATQLDHEADSFGTDYDRLVFSVDELQAALQEGGKVALGGDITLTGEDIAWDFDGDATKKAHLYIPAGVETTLDLSGHTLKNAPISATVRHHVVANYGTLTVTDSVGGGKLISDNITDNPNYAGGFAIISYGDLNLQNATIDSNTGSYAVYIEGAGNTLTVDGAAVSGRGALAVYSGADAVVNSGKLFIDVLTSNARDNVIYLYNATLTVNGGELDGTHKTLGSNPDFNYKGSSCVMLTGTSTAWIYGGTFAASEADLFSHDSNCKIYAYGGSFNTVNALGDSALHEHNNKALVEVYGGTYVYDPSNYLAEGYTCSFADGVYTVTQAA